MKGNKNLFILLIIVLTSGCLATKKTIFQDKEKAESIIETQYYKLFTDATKHALFENYKNAIPLYKACIDIYPDRAAPYYQLSRIYIKINEADIARNLAETAVSLDSSNTWYMKHLANIYQYQGYIYKAIDLYEKILKLKSDDEIRYNLAILYNKASENEKAFKVLNQMEEENQESREVIIMKHNIYHEMRKYDSAVYVLESITKYFPDDISGYGMLAEYLSEIGRNKYAGDVYREILKIEPNNGLAILSFGEFFLKENKTDSAFKYLKRAFCCSDLMLKDKISIVVGYINNNEFLQKNYVMIDSLLDVINKKDRKFEYYAAKADIYINLEKYDKAKPFLDSALIYEKKNFMLWEQTLIINSYLSKNEDVIIIATECLNYFNDKPNIYLFRASAYNNLNLNKMAILDIDSLLNKKSQNRLKIQAYNLAAEIYRQDEEFNKSDSCFEEIIRIDPENLIIRNNYAYYLSLRGVNLKKAEELSRLTIEKEPNNATYLDTYGWVLYKIGNYKQARNYIELAIRNGAYNNAEVLEHYGDIMMSLESCNEALEAYEKAYEINQEIRLEGKITKVKENCE